MNDFKKTAQATMKQYWDLGFNKKWFHTMKFEHNGDPFEERNYPLTKCYADRYRKWKICNDTKRC